MIVLDASAAVDLLFDFGAGAAQVRERIEDEDAGEAHESLHVPHLFEVEVLHAIRDLAVGARISADRGLRAVEALSDLRLIRYSHAPLVARIWDLRSNFTAYDTAYVALAEALDAPLVTTDGRLARAPGHRARVELYP